MPLTRLCCTCIAAGGAGERMGVVIFVGTVTAIYTSAGGLLVSIITDQGQVRWGRRPAGACRAVACGLAWSSLGVLHHEAT